MNEFKVIVCTFSEKSPVQHQMFAKEHSIRNQSEDKPPGKTLFLVNVPPYATSKSLKRVFSQAGPVKNVILQKDVKDSQQQHDYLGYKVAYVVFEKSSDLRKALELKILEQPFSTKQYPIILGVRKLIQDYNETIDRERLSKYCTQTINKYDNDQEKSKREQPVTNEEGWTLVTGKGRHAGLGRTETNKNKLNDKNQKGLKNFYKFQVKDNKINEISALRKKHEEDKKRIETIKKARKFKPY